MRTTRYRKKYLLSGNRRLIPARLIAVGFFIAVCVVAFFVVLYVKKSRAYAPSLSSIYRQWRAGDYPSVYDSSSAVLAKRPQDGAALAMHGFASYYLFAEQNDSTLAQNYIDESIQSLRNAWYRVSDTEKPELAYVLGKAYYQRGYYYADLSLKFLDYAWNANFRPDDIQEFRGLAADMLGESDKSIQAFTDALSVKQSDVLLFTIAKAYRKSGDAERAKQYLYEAIRTTNDDLLLLKCHYELGDIFLGEQNLLSAQSEFDAILEKEPNSADAHYGLGVIYENQGDLIRARAEWRKALKLDPVHAGARAKLNI